MANSATQRAREFLPHEGGVAAVEMAFIAPVALALLSLIVAGGQSMTINHKVILAAHSITDLVSRTPYTRDPSTAQAELLPQSALDADLALAAMVIYPNDSSNLQVVLSEVKVNPSTNTGVVQWSEGYYGASAVKVGTVVNLDPAYAAAGAPYLLIGTATYKFQPLSGIFSIPPMTLSSTETLTIRNAQSITVQWGS